MSTGNSIRKRQRQPVNRHVLRQFRLLAPKPRCPVQRKDANDANLQQPAASQFITSNHDFTSPSLLRPGCAFPSLEQGQYSAVAPCPKIYSNKIPVAPAGDDFPELAPENQFSGVITRESCKDYEVIKRKYLGREK